jgi:hypothetical protein
VQVISSVNSSIQGAAEFDVVRHNTATLAALALASSWSEADTPHENGVGEGEEVVEPETSIDTILGKRVSTSSSTYGGTPETDSPAPKSPELNSEEEKAGEEEVGEEASEEKTEEGVPTEQVVLTQDPEETILSPVPEETILSPVPEEDITLKHTTVETATDPDNATKEFLSPEPMTPDMSPGPEEATEMEVEESVKSSDTEAVTITTTVTVVCPSQGNSPVLERKDEPDVTNNSDEGEGKEEGEGKSEDEGKSEGEEKGEEVTPSIKERYTSSTQILVTDHEEATLSVNLNAYDSDDTLSDEESHDNLPGLDDEEKSPSPKLSPPIKIKEDRTGSGSSHGSNASSTESNEAAKLAVANQRRRCEFIVCGTTMFKVFLIDMTYHLTQLPPKTSNIKSTISPIHYIIPHPCPPLSV